MSVLSKTNAAIKAAALTDADQGALEALRVVARALDSGEFNASMAATYLRYCEALGLTPASRADMSKTKKGAAPDAPSSLAKRRATAASLLRTVS